MYQNPFSFQTQWISPDMSEWTQTLLYRPSQAIKRPLSSYSIFLQQPTCRIRWFIEQGSTFITCRQRWHQWWLWCHSWWSLVNKMMMACLRPACQFINIQLWKTHDGDCANGVSEGLIGAQQPTYPGHELSNHPLAIFAFDGCSVRRSGQLATGQQPVRVFLITGVKFSCVEQCSDTPVEGLTS